MNLGYQHAVFGQLAATINNFLIPERGPVCCLMTMIDDATNTGLAPLCEPSFQPSNRLV